MGRPIAPTGNLKHQTALSVAYGAGLRASEVVALKFGDFDSERMTLRIEQCKGRKDRYAMLLPVLLERLRVWLRVLVIDVKRVRETAHLLDGIAPEATRLLKDRQVIPAVFAVLRKMKPFRQIEAAEMMIAANKFTKPYAETILVTTRTDALTDKAKPKRQEEISPEDISRMEAEIERLQ